MPTKDTKNFPHKSSIAERLKLFGKNLRDYREKNREELFKYSVLILFGLISSLIIQETVAIEHFIGSFLMVTIIFIIFFKDIKRYKPVYLNNNKMMILLGVLTTGTLLLGKLFAYVLLGLQRGLDVSIGTTYVFGIPIPAGAMLITLMFDFHLAIIFSFVMSLLTGIWFYNPYYSVYFFIGSLTAAFCVLRCKRRTALIKGGLYVSAVSLATAGIILLLDGNLLTSAAPPTFLFAALSGILVAAIVSIILPVIEYLFGIVTDMSLVELLDLDQPLMHELMIRAPGTYHHSVIVGTLAEAGAEAVGANPLLTRVCSYYHDIGKTKMPEYFIENQGSGVSKHEKLAPTMSSMILISHVKEGIELARQYKLPRVVTDIIQQHHGTSLISFFYQKALDQKIEVPPQEESFHYPGPKPQTRVAALVMMADAVEAASKILSDPTPSRVAAHVEKIINNIFLAGQIDECELTLKDISEIKRRFTYILNSILHKRIEYPDLDLKAPAQKEERPTAIYDNGSNSKQYPKTDKVKQPGHSAPAQESSQAIGPE